MKTEMSYVNYLCWMVTMLCFRWGWGVMTVHKHRSCHTRAWFPSQQFISSALIQIDHFLPVTALMVPLMLLNDICWQWNGALFWSQHIELGIRTWKREDGRPRQVTVGRPRGPMNLYVCSFGGVNVVLMKQCFNTWLGEVKTEGRRGEDDLGGGGSNGLRGLKPLKRIEYCPLNRILSVRVCLCMCMHVCVCEAQMRQACNVIIKHE